VHRRISCQKCHWRAVSVRGRPRAAFDSCRPEATNPCALASIFLEMDKTVCGWKFPEPALVKYAADELGFPYHRERTPKSRSTPPIFFGVLMSQPVSSAHDMCLLEPLLDGHDLERLLGLSDRTIRRMVSTGLLPAPIRFGRTRRWRLADIKQVLGAAPATASEPTCSVSISK
jgi:predicted DNA-binding transcriptional regulator AlpA